MILELVGLTPAHAHHDRSRYDKSISPVKDSALAINSRNSTTRHALVGLGRVASQGVGGNEHVP